MSNKAIYKPKGKAGEYSEWACNLYNGCSNGCTYCYLKRGITSAVLGQSKPVLKKTLGDSAYDIFCKELKQHKDSIIGDGSGYLFFTFTSDPCLPQTIDLNMQCMIKAVDEGVNVMILTKRADFIENPAFKNMINGINTNKLAIGFTLTGCDNLEPYASTNLERITSMRYIHNDLGIYTWASIEPVINIELSYSMIQQTLGICDLYKIGLLSGRKPSYTPKDVRAFVNDVRSLVPDNKLYWKESVATYIK